MMILFLVVSCAVLTEGEYQFAEYNSNLTTVPSYKIPNNVTDLRLSYNRITILQDFIFANYTVLQNVDLDDNLIYDISPTAFVNTDVVHLHLNDNLLTEIPDLCSINGSLENLELARNDIGVVSAENVTCLKKLNRLELSENNMTSFPYFGDVAATLQVLSIKYNYIKHIEAAQLSELKVLRELYLDGNLLTAFPDFSRLPDPGLTILHMAETPLNRIPPDLFQALPNIQELSLRNLEDDPYELPTFNPSSTTIKIVDFSGNYFENISESVLQNLASAMPNVRYLKFRSIIAPSLPYLDRAFSNHDLELDVSHNTFKCNCSVSWLMEPSKNIIKLDLTGTTCSEESHPSLRKKLINTLTTAELCPIREETTIGTSFGQTMSLPSSTPRRKITTTGSTRMEISTTESATTKSRTTESSTSESSATENGTAESTSSQSSTAECSTAESSTSESSATESTTTESTTTERTTKKSTATEIATVLLPRTTDAGSTTKVSEEVTSATPFVNTFVDMVTTVAQSSIWNDNKPDNAADSNVRTCAITGYERRHWLMVEMSKMMPVAGINLNLLWEMD